MEKNLETAGYLHVQQAYEGFEIVLGWESRNKYRIFDEKMNLIAFAAEQNKGFLASIARQFFGHWRSFDVTVFGADRQPVYQLHFPFRWFFKTLYIRDRENQLVGYAQQRFAIFRKKFDLHDSNNQKIAYINSSFFRFWTFDVFARKKIGSIQKKWSGALSEMFTDRDNFVVTFEDPEMTTETKALLLGTCLMVDLVYFESKKGGGLGGIVDLFD